MKHTWIYRQTLIKETREISDKSYRCHFSNPSKISHTVSHTRSQIVYPASLLLFVLKRYVSWCSVVGSVYSGFSTLAVSIVCISHWHKFWLLFFQIQYHVSKIHPCCLSIYNRLFSNGVYPPHFTFASTHPGMGTRTTSNFSPPLVTQQTPWTPSRGPLWKFFGISVPSRRRDMPILYWIECCQIALQNGCSSHASALVHGISCVCSHIPINSWLTQLSN